MQAARSQERRTRLQGQAPRPCPLSYQGALELEWRQKLPSCKLRMAVSFEGGAALPQLRHEAGARKIEGLITELKGFYVRLGFTLACVYELLHAYSLRSWTSSADGNHGSLCLPYEVMFQARSESACLLRFPKEGRANHCHTERLVSSRVLPAVCINDRLCSLEKKLLFCLYLIVWFRFVPCVVRRKSRLEEKVNPLPFTVIRKVVEDELLGGLPLTEVFESFDERPLGSASIAQVHRARLRGGREVAVKVQRPNVERRLMSDIGVVKQFSLITREIFPVDYYLVCSELEEQLQDEFNFMAEASGMDRIADALDRNGRRPPVQVPRSIPGLTSKQVLCMDFIPGAPLSQLREELKRRGIEIEPGSLAEQAGREVRAAVPSINSYCISGLSS